MTSTGREDATDRRRLRVLMSAVACGPCEEPEASAGWAFARAAAVRHDVWVVTRPRFRAEIEAELAADPALVRHLRVEFRELPRPLVRLRRRLPGDVYWFHSLWQWTLPRHLRRLHRRIGFDVAHHVTFANDWLPCGIIGLRDVPLVWGPVGGASSFDYWRLRRWLGARGLVWEVLRSATTGTARRLFGDPVARRAAVVVAQNDDVAARFGDSRRVVVEPNAALEPSPSRTPAATTPAATPAATSAATSAAPPAAPPGGDRTALFVGRLVGWKGALLAVAVMAHPAASRWRLRVFGDGADRARLERAAERLGVAERVEFLGHRPRAEVLAAYDDADALLFPSFHDQAGWVAGEASSAGCPVVCLPLGGPPILAGVNAHVAALEGDVVANLAGELERAGERRGVRHTRWSSERLPALVDDWYADAAGTARDRGAR